MKVILVLFFFIIPFVNWSQNNLSFSNEEKQWLKDNPVVYYGYDPDWKPIEFKGEDGLSSGISSDFVKLLSSKVGIELKPYPNIKDWAHAIELLKKREILFLPALAQNEERNKLMDFTSTYLEYPFVIVTQKEGDFVGSVSDLNGKKVSTSSGYYITGLLEQEQINIKFDYKNGLEECLMSVSTGETEATVANLAVVSYYLNYNGYDNLKIASPTNYPKLELKMGIAKNNPVLLSILEKTIKSITEPEKNEIVQNWVSVQYDYGIDMKKIWTYALIALGVVLIIVLSIVYWNRKLQKQINLRKLAEERLQNSFEQIQQQKTEIEHQNKEVMDSIAYAKRIQEAILPPMEMMNKALPNSFVLFKPKDIVSGDFYWMVETEESVYFASVDCTGHGVPGAMVSVIGYNGLNRAVKEFGLTDTGQILDKLTQMVEETFEKSASEVKDGMDLALCCLNKKTNELTFSGANNPLWIVSERDTINVNDQEFSVNRETENGKLFEVKADKQPIGNYAKRVPYKTNKIALNKGDLIYVFTDGYADQFGGPKGKKYKYKPFKDLLIQNAREELNTQEKNLDNTIESWRGELEQIDDICVIGVKI